MAIRYILFSKNITYLGHYEKTKITHKSTSKLPTSIVMKYIKMNP
jgi:hypothetical protein